jgi:hypothetical protein
MNTGISLTLLSMTVSSMWNWKMELRKFMAKQGVSEKDCMFWCNLGYLGDDEDAHAPY